MAADGRGHIYILFPQYGAISDCPTCIAPTMALVVSNDNGLSWQTPNALVPSSTGQFDPQIVVDPVDRQTVYASWVQNNKRDVMVARSQDFGASWYLTIAEHSREDADKPALAVHGADVYVGFNHEQRFVVAASHDYAQNFSSTTVNPSAEPGWSLAGGATVGPAGERLFCVDDLRAARTEHAAGKRLCEPLGGCWTKLEHGSAGRFERAAGLCRPRMRGRVSGRADCAGVGRGGNGLCAVERGQRTRRARAHLLFVFDHGWGKLVGEGRRLDRR